MLMIPLCPIFEGNKEQNEEKQYVAEKISLSAKQYRL